MRDTVSDDSRRYAAPLRRPILNGRTNRVMPMPAKARAWRHSGSRQQAVEDGSCVACIAIPHCFRGWLVYGHRAHVDVDSELNRFERGYSMLVELDYPPAVTCLRVLGFDP
jgi:hypothetical protein